MPGVRALLLGRTSLLEDLPNVWLTADRASDKHYGSPDCEYSIADKPRRPQTDHGI